jgi:hypothetical protein
MARQVGQRHTENPLIVKQVGLDGWKSPAEFALFALSGQIVQGTIQVPSDCHPLLAPDTSAAYM